MLVVVCRIDGFILPILSLRKDSSPLNVGGLLLVCMHIVGYCEVVGSDGEKLVEDSILFRREETNF